MQYTHKLQGWIESVGCADRSAYDLTAHSKQTREKLMARDTLPEPILSEKLILEINKPKFGPAFKKNARFVQGYFETLKNSESEWDEAKIQDLDQQLKANQGYFSLSLLKYSKKIQKNYDNWNRWPTI